MNQKHVSILYKACQSSLLLLPLLAMLLAGCGPSADEKAAAEQQAKVKKIVKKVQPADPLAGLSSAITGSKGTLPVDVRFELLDRPEPNKPTNIRLVFVPAIDLYGIQAVIKSAAGLKVADDAHVKFDAPKKDELKDYKFEATPNGAGIFLVNVDVTVTRDTGDTLFNFSLPVPVPDAEASISPPPPPVAASVPTASK